MLEQTQPVLLGVLDDTPGDGLQRELFERAVRLAFGRVESQGRFSRAWELVYERAQGLPWGSAKAVEDAYARLAERGVLAILGPAIGDNALVATPLADAAALPTLNWAGTEHARGPYMFHFQVGSLEEEPVLLARHLARVGLPRVSVVHDRSPIGSRLVSAFDEAAPAEGITALARIGVSPLEKELGDRIEPALRAQPQALVYLGLGLSARAVAQALRKSGWQEPVLCNSAGMFGRIDREWARALEGWTYVDVVSDHNRVWMELARELDVDAERIPALAYQHDMARLVAEGLAHAPELTRHGVRAGLEKVKWLPSAVGRDGTMMGFGAWERGALKGAYLVLRRWASSRSVEVE